MIFSDNAPELERKLTRPVQQRPERTGSTRARSSSRRISTTSRPSCRRQASRRTSFGWPKRRNIARRSPCARSKRQRRCRLRTPSSRKSCSRTRPKRSRAAHSEDAMGRRRSRKSSEATLIVAVLMLCVVGWVVGALVEFVSSSWAVLLSVGGLAVAAVMVRLLTRPKPATPLPAVVVPHANDISLVEPKQAAPLSMRSTKRERPERIPLGAKVGCPTCARTVTVGDTTCRHCGAALHMGQAGR